MKLTVIGASGGYPKIGEASAGYLLEDKGFTLLIDCGSAVLSKMQEFKQPEELDAVILSHYHPDHMADIGVLQHARLIQGFLGKKTSILPIYGHDENEYEFQKLNYKNISHAVTITEDQPLVIGPFTITLQKTNHPVTCFAMRIEVNDKVIVYTGDTSFNEQLAAFVKDTDLLLCECNFYGNQNGKGAGHMNSLDAGRLAEMAKVKHLVLTHLPHYGNIETLRDEALTEYKGPISLAAFGQTYEI